MNEIRPVYVDGPLKGQDFPVRAASISSGVNASDYGQDTLAGVGRAGSLPVVHYTLHRFGFRSGGSAVLLWIGWSAGEPAAEVLADLLLSDAAKAAIIREPS
jgi:hypothetical protein